MNTKTHVHNGLRSNDDVNHRHGLLSADTGHGRQCHKPIAARYTQSTIHHASPFIKPSPHKMLLDCYQIRAVSNASLSLYRSWPAMSQRRCHKVYAIYHSPCKPFHQAGTPAHKVYYDAPDTCTQSFNVNSDSHHSILTALSGKSDSSTAVGAEIGPAFHIRKLHWHYACTQKLPTSINDEALRSVRSDG